MPDTMSRNKKDSVHSSLTPNGFTIFESITVIAIMGALFFVLAPPFFYRMGWMTPPPKDVDFQIRPMMHPTASRLPEHVLQSEDQETEKPSDKKGPKSSDSEPDGKSGKSK